MDSPNQKTGAETHTEEQKRHFYDNLTEDQKKKQTFSEWVKEAYNDQYEKWMPWLEEQYLKWFGKGDNKASYVAKDTLSKSKVTGIKQVDQVQDDVNNLVGNQLGENGFLAPVGNMISKEGINRAERNGKDEDGSYGGPLGGVTDPVVDRAKGAGQSVTSGAQTVGNSISGGFQSAGNWFTGSPSKEQRS
ncbi:uncharacterized protein P174DRAFT_463381 [Aspergillus novofumigatus IBT 16806]|uniref:Uncharacterized protein n=1 Tax=Aspergillus novofumigatus (strain IBT 16806) TaxID=1392255 RepID=A0A2I1C0W1_ASPN1|nr:uncharacterized protein P174DRAFT_463381 [Aspergillus novofumigatus IBT 16806]PKX91259.1 hypothetical protein P174DRAFT_463381 [Aspergillus novofumigatus IBT 16806]